MDFKYSEAVMSGLTQMRNFCWLNACDCHDMAAHITSTSWRFNLWSDWMWPSRFYNAPDIDNNERTVWYLDFINVVISQTIEKNRNTEDDPTGVESVMFGWIVMEIRK